MRIRFPFVVVALAMVMSALAAQEIYKWIDAEGRVHYGDRPPKDAGAERVELPTPTGPTRDPSEELRRVVEQADLAAERRAADRQAAAAAAQAASATRSALEGRCLEARIRLAVLQQQAPVYRDERGQIRLQWARDTYTGKREYLDDATRAVEAAGAQQQIDTSCRQPNDAAEQNRARTIFALSELCAAARAELAELEKPSARTPRSELENKRGRLARLCELQ